MIKHVGKHDQRRAVLLFREIPGDDGDMCLIVYTDKLPSLIEEPMMKCIESEVGQNSNDISGPLSRTLMDNGQNVLEVLHRQGYIRKVPANQMILQPNAQTTIRVDELNKLLREMDSGAEAHERLAEMDAQAGIKDPAKSLKNLNKPDPVPQAAPVQAAADGVLSDEDIAKGQLSQAEALKADAQRLLNEAQTLESEAYNIAPSLKPKAKAKRKAPAPKAKAKRGPGRPRKNAAAST
jgi:hypothetical protein